MVNLGQSCTCLNPSYRHQTATRTPRTPRTGSPRVIGPQSHHRPPSVNRGNPERCRPDRGAVEWTEAVVLFASVQGDLAGCVLVGGRKAQRNGFWSQDIKKLIHWREPRSLKSLNLEARIPKVTSISLMWLWLSSCHRIPQPQQQQKRFAQF